MRGKYCPRGSENIVPAACVGWYRDMRERQAAKFWRKSLSCANQQQRFVIMEKCDKVIYWHPRSQWDFSLDFSGAEGPLHYLRKERSEVLCANVPLFGEKHWLHVLWTKGAVSEDSLSLEAVANIASYVLLSQPGWPLPLSKGFSC